MLVVDDDLCYWMLQVTDMEDAMGERFHAFCTDPSNPISILRGLVEAVGFGRWKSQKHIERIFLLDLSIAIV